MAGPYTVAEKYDAAAAAEKQVRRAQAATQDYIRGVEGVKDSPMVKAYAKKEKMLANFKASVDSKKWEDNMLAVSLGQWQAITAKKGGQRYAQGIEESAHKVLEFHEQFSAFLAVHLPKIKAMPDSTPEQRIQRMVENARGIAKFKRVRKRA